MFKWVCLLVAVAALSAYGWMLNDIRLEVKGLAPRADRLMDKAEALVEKTDQYLPRLLAQTEQVATTLDGQLPTLLAHTEVAVEGVAELTDNFQQYKGLMGVVHGARQDKGLLSYGLSILGLLGGQNARVGVKKPAPKSAPPVIEKPVQAKEWAGAARKDVHFLSLVATSKEEMLHALARTRSPAPWYIQVGEQAPRLLADWVKEMHPESKGVD